MTEPINPYAPSLTPQPQAPLTDPFAPRAWAPPYRSAQGTARLVVVLTVIVIIVQLLFAGSSYLQVQLLYTAQGGRLDPALAQANDVRHQGIALMVLGAALVNFVGLLVWIYAAHRNLPALGSPHLEFTPGWAVGWFFIPIMNLFKPCQALLELWRESDPARLPPISMRGPPKSAAIVGWWWGLRIFAGVTGQIVAVVTAQDNTLEGLITASWLAIVLTLLLDIPTDLCLIKMVLGVQNSQEERHGLVIAPTSQPAATASSANRWGDFR